MMQVKSRNTTVDVLRGTAMLLVVLGHTMSGCVEGAQNSFLFQIVWTLQMPLFMLISGYVTKFSKQISSKHDLWEQLKKKTIAYLLPWAVWTFIVRGVVLGQSNFLNIKWLLWHMDSGYWFLFSIWTIVVVFTVASYFANKTKFPFIVQTAFYALGMAVLVGLGLMFGLSFLGIKLTLYYMPFFYAGYMYTLVEKRFGEEKWFGLVQQVVPAICLAIWLFIISRYNIAESDESISEILMRIISSTTGCIALSGLIGNCARIPGGGIAWIGSHSLEIYTIHYLCLSMLRTVSPPQFTTLMGVGIVIINFVVTVVVTISVAVLLNQNRILRMLLFGKN